MHFFRKGFKWNFDVNIYQAFLEYWFYWLPFLKIFTKNLGDVRRRRYNSMCKDTKKFSEEINNKMFMFFLYGVHLLLLLPCAYLRYCVCISVYGSAAYRLSWTTWNKFIFCMILLSSKTWLTHRLLVIFRKVRWIIKLQMP